MTLTKV